MCSVRRATCRARNDTAKLMSGIVHPAIHCRNPTISWKGVSGADGHFSAQVVAFPRSSGSGVILGRCPGNRSTFRSMYAGWVSQSFLACRSRRTFIPRMVDTSPSCVIFQRHLSPFISSSISVFDRAATTRASTYARSSAGPRSLDPLR
jgi:hypothetical protein